MIHQIMVRSAYWFKPGPERSEKTLSDSGSVCFLVPFLLLSGLDGTYIANRDMHGKVDHVKTNEPYVEWGSLEFA